MIVVDVGAASYGTDESILFLINEFKPTVYYGFDPSPEFGQGITWLGETQVITLQAAAWIEDGEIAAERIGFGVTLGEGKEMVECFDLAAVLKFLPEDKQTTVLKLDAEKCEYQILPHLIEKGIDENLALVWCEWHCLACGYGRFQTDDRCSHCGHTDPGLRSSIEGALRCETRQWDR